jgi:hypothetical protein
MPDIEPSLDLRNLHEFFRDSLRNIFERQNLRVQEHTEHYVVNLLALYSSAENVSASSNNSPTRGLNKPLALLLAEAASAPTAEERYRGLQTLGDWSLFLAGFFPERFARRTVDIDYHISMGGSAYGTLAEVSKEFSDNRRKALMTVFAELSCNFQRLVEALNELSETARGPCTNQLRLYEIWLKTGSDRALRQLRAAGVTFPLEVSLNRRQ